MVEDRHGRKSTIIASQLPSALWYEIIGEPTLADAILDRVVTKCASNRTHRRIVKKKK
ncbi:MAG: ATP-binding protein [Bacteroidetes bacterium]|nr:ATP-binding protein [Bacteroidota bacterium]